MLSVKQVLNHAFYLKDHSTTDEYIRYLEGSFNKLKAGKEDIWDIAKLLAEHSLKNARAFEKNKMLPACFNELNRAWRVLHPVQSLWKEKIEWKVLRFNTFSHLAEYYRRIQDIKNEAEMWEKVLKLEATLPKMLVNKNRRQITELSYAIVLTKLAEFEKAELFAKRAVQALERELKINKTVKIEENICPSKDPKDVAHFKLRMQSLCLAYHHLASIKKHNGQSAKAEILFGLSKALGKKYIKDKKLLKIISPEEEKKKSAPTLIGKRKSMSDLGPLSSFSNKPNDQQLLAEIFGKNKMKALKVKNQPATANVSVLNASFVDSMPSISKNIKEASFGYNERRKNQKDSLKYIDDKAGQNKVRVFNDISHFRKIEVKAALMIQKFYRGFVTRKNTKKFITDYVIKMMPENENEDSDLDYKTDTPSITINKVKESLLEFPQNAIYLNSESPIPEEPNSPSEYVCSDSDPEILISEKPSKLRRQRTHQATLFDFLNLLTPDLYISQNLGSRIFTWRICIGSVRVHSGVLNYTFQIFGYFERFTDTLFYTKMISFDTTKTVDYRLICPFSFQTVWPVIEIELTKDLESSFEESEELSDETSIAVIKDIANFILIRSQIQYTMIGPRLGFGNQEVRVYEKHQDFIANKFLYSKEGVISVMMQFAKHEVKDEGACEGFYKKLETEAVGCILTKGIVSVLQSYLMLKVQVVECKSSRTKYSTALQFGLVALRSNWFDNYIMHWEEAQKFFLQLGLQIDIFYIFTTKTLQNAARDTIYNNFSEYFSVKNSKIIRKPEKDKLVIEESTLVESSETMPLQCHEEWDANLESYEEFISHNEVSNLCLGVIPGMKLRGEIEKIHIKVSVLNKNILIHGKPQTRDESFSLLVRDFSKVNRILKVFEMGEVVKSILENEICIQKSLCGKKLSYEAFLKKNTYSAIRKIGAIKYLITVTTTKNFTISIYSLASSWHLQTSFGRDDLATYFPGLDSSEFAGIFYEYDFFNPLIQDFQLFQGISGTFSGWKVKQETQDTLNTSRSINTFQFSTVKVYKQQEIVTVKPLSERRISRVLKEPVSCLMETVFQEEVILQRSRFICGLFALVTITKLHILEEWRVYVHIFQNSREFVCKLYDSDMFGLEEHAFDRKFVNKNHVVNRAVESKKLWEVVLAECKFEFHYSLDFVFKFDNIVSPLRELLYANHVKYECHHYYEVFLKSSVSFNAKFNPIASIKESENVVLTIRSYNLTRKLWEKASMKLKDCILILLNAGVVTENLLLNTYITYCQLKFFAGTLCRIIKMKHQENSVPVRLFPPLDFSESEEEDLFSEKNSSNHSVSSIFEQDILLYQCVYRVRPALIIGVYYNELSDDFAFKMYKPAYGAMFKVPLSRKQVFRKVPFSKTLYKEKSYLLLGKRIYNELVDRILPVVTN